MKLTVFERLNLLQVFPKESDFATLKIVRGLQTNVGLSEEDFKEFEVKQEGEQIKWNEKGNEEREIEIGDKGKEIISNALKELDKEKKITTQLFSLYEKFLGEK